VRLSKSQNISEKGIEMSDNQKKCIYRWQRAIYEIDGIENIVEKDINMPFDRLSDKIIAGVINGINCAFLPRHNRGHILINQKANIYALKFLGVE
jgi:5'-methylthioadenosine phosphorylase